MNTDPHRELLDRVSDFKTKLAAARAGTLRPAPVPAPPVRIETPAADLERRSLVRCYHDMIRRCTVPTHKSWSRYGGRGISVCRRWVEGGPDVFIADMGPRLPGMTLDREKNDLGYSPENCRWADQATQIHNSTVSKLDWPTVRLIRSCAELGYSAAAIHQLVSERIDIQLTAVRRVIAGESWAESDS